MEFIGPSWWGIRDLGDKINTKRIARSLDVPTVPGSDRPVYSEMEAEAIAAKLFEFQAAQGIVDGRGHGQGFGRRRGHGHRGGREL